MMLSCCLGYVVYEAQETEATLHLARSLIERFFRDITTERLRRGVFTNGPELITAIDEYIDHHNTKPKPFILKKAFRPRKNTKEHEISKPYAHIATHPVGEHGSQIQHADFLRVCSCSFVDY
jgi:hypothetical protein